MAAIDILTAEAPARLRARAAAVLRRAVRFAGAGLIAEIAALSLIVLLLPGAIGAACAQGPAGGHAATAEPPPAGLFFRTERAEAVLEAPRLKSDVRIAVNGLISRVTVRQRFVNPTKLWMEGVYVFPLPERSAVDRLHMTVGGRRVEGRIMERETARKTYEQAAAEGRRASLLSAARANVFTTSVANIGPGDEIVVEIEYQDTVAYGDGRLSLRFPMVVAPRYTPPGSRPVARRAAPQARTAATPSAAGRDLFGPVRPPDRGPSNPLSLAVTLDAGLPLERLESLYHPVDVEPAGERRWVVTLKHGPVPAERDFVLEWRPALGAAPEAAVFGEELDGDSYLSVMVLPPAGAAADTVAIPRDLVFVVDTSGSMHGVSLEQAKAAMLLALERLAPGERFNVIRFAGETHTLFREVQPATPSNLRRARAYVRGMRARGGTDMMPALFRALTRRPEPERLRQVVFLTDGAVGNESELFQAIAELLGETRLFTIGIGSAPNSYFMRKAAELGRGTFTYIGDAAEVGARMGALLGKLERPALTGVQVAWPGLDGQAVEAYPAPVPDLYAGEPVVFSARLAETPPETLSGDLVITGHRGAADWRRRLPLAAVEAAPGVAAIWARAKLARIEEGRFRRADPAEVRAKALAVALRHRLVTRYTSLVAVDEEVVRPPGARLEAREIERNLPHGWDWRHVFGDEEPRMRLRSLPPGLMRQIKAAGRPVSLPQTATSAPLRALIGLGLLSLGVVVLLALRRGRRRGRSGA